MVNSLTTNSFVSAETKKLSMEEFIQLASQNDQFFEVILIDVLELNYRKALHLPAKDIVLSIKSQYDFMLSQDREEPEMTMSLNKLFPYTGTEGGLVL